MTAYRFEVTWTNDAMGAFNPALISFVTDNSETFGQNVAQIVAYCRLAGAAYAQPSKIAGVTSSEVDFTLPGHYAPKIPQPFPLTEWNALRGTDSALPAWSGWGGSVSGGGGAMPAGTSVNVAEYTDLGGRHNGRHYLPWVGSGVLDSSGGGIQSATITAISDAYYKYILPSTVTGGRAQLFPIVVGKTVASSINGIVVRSATSKLRSRTR